MVQQERTKTKHFSCIFILCFCSFLFGTWVHAYMVTTQYTLSNFLQPNLYLWTYKNKSGEKILFENNQTWLYNTTCVKKKVTLSKTSLPLTGLVSFPGSGNTWTRHLIQQMTGLGTSSVYCDLDLEKGGFPYECHKQWSKTIVIKTHVPKDVTLFTKIVFLIRNPYDAFLSFTNFQHGGHKGRSSDAKMIKALTKKFEMSLEWYVDLARNITVTFKGPVHMLQYEKLKTDMVTELRKLAEFLGANATERDIYCTVKLQEGNFHRNATDENNIKLLQRIFKKEKLLRIQKIARYTEKLLKDAYDIDVDLKGPEDRLWLKEDIKR